MEFEAGSKSGFNSSKDHDERIAGAVSGGNEHISGRISLAYQKFGSWFDGHGDVTLLDNTQTGLQYSDRLDIMGTGTLNIDESRQLQLITQYYKSQGTIITGLISGKASPLSVGPACHTLVRGCIPTVFPALSGI